MICSESERAYTHTFSITNGMRRSSQTQLNSCRKRKRVRERERKTACNEQVAPNYKMNAKRRWIVWNGRERSTRLANTFYSLALSLFCSFIRLSLWSWCFWHELSGSFWWQTFFYFGAWCLLFFSSFLQYFVFLSMRSSQYLCVCVCVESPENLCVA